MKYPIHDFNQDFSESITAVTAESLQAEAEHSLFNGNCLSSWGTLSSTACLGTMSACVSSLGCVGSTGCAGDSDRY